MLVVPVNCGSPKIFFLTIKINTIIEGVLKHRAAPSSTATPQKESNHRAGPERHVDDVLDVVAERNGANIGLCNGAQQR